MKQTIRHLAIRAGLEAFAATTTPKTVRQGPRHSVIFTLHHVRPEAATDFQPNAHLSITPQFLGEAISECLACGFTPVALSDLPRRMADEPEGRFVAFTLDDGCRDNRDYAAPVFREYDAPYTLFVTKGLAQRTSTMWWETAEEAIRIADVWTLDGDTMPAAEPRQKAAAFARTAGMIQSAADESQAVAFVDEAARAVGASGEAIVLREIMDEGELVSLSRADPLAELGVHTLTHRNMARLTPAELHGEIAGCAEWIEDLTGRRPTAIAYPYGSDDACGEREAAAAQEAGLSIGVTTRPGRIVDPSASPLLLPRVSLNGLYQQRRFVRALLSGRMLKAA